METGSYLAQLALQLVLILAIIVGSGWLLRRFGRGVSTPGQIRVTAMRNLGGKERLVVVEIDGRYLLLGVSPGGLSTLHEFETPPEPSAEAECGGEFDRALNG